MGSFKSPFFDLLLCFSRYFLCEIISEDPRCRQFIEERIVHSAVKNAVARIHGDFGVACCSIAFSGLVSRVLLVQVLLD